MPDLFTTTDLIGAIRTIKVPDTFFLSTFFDADPFLSDKDEIAFDEVLDDLPVMAPFVSPLVSAKPQAKSGFKTKTFTPAYVKPMDILRPGDGFRRMAGEAINGALSTEARIQRKALELIAKQKRQIVARWEWMAAHAVLNGAVTVAGEDYPAVVVDFGRDASLTTDVSAVTAKKWDTAANDIKGQVEDWSEMLLSMSGYAGTDLILTKKAWAALKANTEFKTDLDRRRGVDNVPLVTPRKPMSGVTWKGQWGEFDLWLYTGTQREQDGTLVSVMIDGEVALVARPMEPRGGLAGIKAFGAIQDLDNFVPADMYPKEWTKPDPSARFLMTQSAPLMIPGRPNASLKSKVVA